MNVTVWNARRRPPRVGSEAAQILEHTWPTVEQWLQSEPGVSAKELMHRLAAMMPDVYSTTAQLRTLQRHVKAWRTERARQLIWEVLQPAELNTSAATALVDIESEQSR